MTDEAGLAQAEWEDVRRLRIRSCRQEDGSGVVLEASSGSKGLALDAHKLDDSFGIIN